MYVAHPHIGTFKLVKVVENLREQIIALGGEIRFEQRVTDVIVENDAQAPAPPARPEGAEPGHGRDHRARCRPRGDGAGPQLARHLAMLYERGVAMEAKPFSIGFRIEHPQSVIDRARWGRHAGHPLLGAADYKLVHHAQNGRAVYSFACAPAARWWPPPASPTAW